MLAFFTVLTIFGALITVLIYLGKLPLGFRYTFLFVLLACVTLSIFVFGLSITDLGLSVPSIKEVTVYGILMAVGLIISGITDAKDKMDFASQISDGQTGSVVFYILISAPVQQFVFIAYPLAAFRQIGWETFFGYVSFCAIIFSFAHFFLKNQYFMIFTFLMGAAMALVFYFLPNIWMATLCHAVWGASNINSRNSKSEEGDNDWIMEEVY